MTKQQIIAAVLECAEKLGHVPSHTEVMKTTNVSRKQIRWHFGAYARLLRECNLEGAGSGYKVEMDELFRDWAGIARDLNKLPTIAEYERTSQYSVRPLITRFGSWTQAPHGLKQYAEEQGWAEEWKDVLELVASQGEDRRGRARRLAAVVAGDGPDNTEGARRSMAMQGPDNVRKATEGREVYGLLMRPWPMVCAPTNEQGVLFLFGAMAESLGFAVLKIGTAYPDCEAFRVVEGGRLERVKIEFELDSRNFLRHMHDASKADMIVCWRHNWPECPLEVIALSEMQNLPRRHEEEFGK
jgi:hypothetical protein